MKTRTKLLALVLTLAMLVSVFAAFPVSAATYYFQVGDNQYATLSAALSANTGEGVEVKMIADYAGSENVTDAGGASWSLDGQGHTWTTTSGEYCLRVGKAEQVVTITNITFDYQGTNTRVLQVSERSKAHLTLGTGVTITGKPTGIAIMQQAASIVTIDGAEFTTKVPAIGTWNGTTTPSVILNSGTLSYGKAGTGNAETGAIVNGFGTLPANITLNSKNIQVTDYTVDPAETRQLYLADITALNSVSYADGLSAADFTPVDMTQPFYVSAAHSDSGIDGTYGTLGAAVAAVKNGGTIKLINDVSFSDRDTIASSKTYTVDGAKSTGTGSYTITDARSGDIIKFNGSSTVTMTNINFVSTATGSADSILFLGDGITDTLILGEGVTFGGTGVPGAGAIMHAAGTLTIDGAQFDIACSAIAAWNNNTRIINLESGTLSNGASAPAIKGAGGTTTINYKGVMQVKDNQVSPVVTRDMNTNDIGIFSGTYTLNEEVDLPAPTNVYITINDGATKYLSLADAVAAAQDGDTLTVTGQMSVSSAAVIVGKTLTLQGADANASITVNGDYAVMILHNATVTVTNLKLNGSSTTSSGVVTLGDTTSGQVAYTGATLILNSGAVISILTGGSGGANTGGNGVSALVNGDNNVTVNTGATITTCGTALRADDGGNLKVVIAGGTVTSSGRGMVIGGASTGSSLTMTSGTFSVTGSAWLLKTYTTTFKANLAGGTLSAATGKVFDESDASALDGCVTLGDVTIMSNGAVVYDASYKATFTDNDMMYLYVDAEKTTAGSGLGFASQVNLNTSATVTYGVLIAVDGDVDTVLDHSCDMYNYNGKAVLNVAVEGLNTNGFVKGAVVGLNASMMNNAFVGRAYATVTVTIDDITVTTTTYGQQMSATARDFARAYAEANTEIDTETQAVVAYFLANGNVTA